MIFYNIGDTYHGSNYVGTVPFLFLLWRSPWAEQTGPCLRFLWIFLFGISPKNAQETYESLANDMQWKVRRTLANSIHELAVILGPEVASQDLVPIFNGFIKDLDEVDIFCQIFFLKIFVKIFMIK